MFAGSLPMTDPLLERIATERHREIATEHLLFQALAFLARRHPDLIDELDRSVDRLGDRAHDDTRDDEAVRTVARRFIASLRKDAA